MVLAGLSVLLQLWKELIIFPLESSLALASNNLWIVIMRFAASPSCQNFLQNDAFASYSFYKHSPFFVYKFFVRFCEGHLLDIFLSFQFNIRLVSVTDLDRS